MQLFSCLIFTTYNVNNNWFFSALSIFYIHLCNSYIILLSFFPIFYSPLCNLLPFFSLCADCILSLSLSALQFCGRVSGLRSRSFLLIGWDCNRLSLPRCFALQKGSFLSGGRLGRSARIQLEVKRWWVGGEFGF